MSLPHVAWTRILHHFSSTDLSPALQEIAQLFDTLAHTMTAVLDNTADPDEVTVGLRKLLEAKEACLRAARARSNDA